MGSRDHALACLNFKVYVTTPILVTLVNCDDVLSGLGITYCIDVTLFKLSDVILILKKFLQEMFFYVYTSR